MSVQKLTKTQELVIYLANHFPNEKLTQLVMHKLLYFIDKKSIENLGNRFTEGMYTANHWGPTHNYLKVTHPYIQEWVNVFKKGRIFYSGIKDLDDYSFTDKEKQLIDGVIAKYSGKSVDEIMKDSHDENWESIKNSKNEALPNTPDNPIISPNILQKIRSSAQNN